VTHDAGYRLSRWLFLRGLGLVLLIAFASLAVQIEGLVGERGLLPLGDYLERVREAHGGAAWLRLPTLFWLAHGDASLIAACGAGALASLAVIAGWATLPALVLCWALYLSLTLAGQSFTSFQWDVLLLETCFTALFVAPWGWRPRRPHAEPLPSRAGLWLVRALLFKLMFLSGVVKLLSMDEAWWSLTALDAHYYTQPLPPWTAWYAHRLPEGFQRASVLVTLAIEIGLPFAIFFGRRGRQLAAAGFSFLMLAIAATGNYNFFNLLTVVLCVPLVDDAGLARLVPRRFRSGLVVPPGAGTAAAHWLRALRLAAAGALLVTSLLVSVREMVRTGPEGSRGAIVERLSASAERWLLSWGGPRVLAYADPFHTVNGYGLFRSMTTRRSEIVIEGSDDGRVWREYGFRWKPGAVSERPRFVQPHQPRLDWQMWFAALAPSRQAHWLDSLMARLLEGEPTVLALLGEDPFAGRPPRHVRLLVYDYTFSDPAERRAGAWWRRGAGRPLTTRPLSLEDFTSR
jgi:hypothetical protein